MRTKKVNCKHCAYVDFKSETYDGQEVCLLCDYDEYNDNFLCWTADDDAEDCVFDYLEGKTDRIIREES